MRVYIALKYYPDYRNGDIVDRISAAFERMGHETVCIARDVEEKGKVELEPAELMRITFRKIDVCDLVVIDFSEKGTGLGIEAGYAYAKGIPVITVAREGAEISDTLRGISRDIFFYSSMEDIEGLFDPIFGS